MTNLFIHKASKAGVPFHIDRYYDLKTGEQLPQDPETRPCRRDQLWGIAWRDNQGELHVRSYLVEKRNLRTRSLALSRFKNFQYPLFDEELEALRKEVGHG